jgi:hypothetical protein
VLGTTDAEKVNVWVEVNDFECNNSSVFIKLCEDNRSSEAVNPLDGDGDSDRVETALEVWA